MTPEIIAASVSTIIASNMGIISLFFGLIILGLFRRFVDGIVAGLQFRFSGAYPGEQDTIVILVGDKHLRGRIQKIGLKNTVFYIREDNGILIVPNEKLKDLYIRKILPKIDL